MNNPIEGLEGLPDEQKNALMTQIEEMQVRDRYSSRQIKFSLQKGCEKGVYMLAVCVCTTMLWSGASGTV